MDAGRQSAVRLHRSWSTARSAPKAQHESAAVGLYEVGRPFMAQSPLSYGREGRGPHLLLIHGGVGSRSHWQRNVPGLARHFTVTAVDLPGFGESADVPRDIAPDAYLDLVADAVHTWDLPRLHVAGFSFGAVVAVALAVRMPGAIARLALVGPGGFGLPTCLLYTSRCV